MAISGIASTGLMSGLDVGGLVSKILDVEKKPVALLSVRKNDYELKIASILNLSSKLSLYKSSIESLNDSEKFNTKTASVSKTSGGTELLTVSASSDATEGSHSITVKQLAASNKKASQGWIDKNSTSISSSTGSLKFKVGSSGAETSIGVTNSTTLQGLVDKINTENADVTASIMNDGTGSNPYRLVLTADNTGSSKTISITQNDTDLDFANKNVEAGYAYTDNTYSGTFSSNEGNNYTGTTNKTFLMQTVTGGESGVATYKYSVDGGITWLGYGGVTYDSSASDDTSGGAITTSTSLKDIDGAGSENEGVQASFSSGSDLAAGDKFTIDVFNPEMQEAQDAVVEIDNATVVKSTNTITDAIPGITMKLLQADTSSTLTLTVSSNTSTAKEDIENFVQSYNDLIEFINDQLSYDPESEEVNPLLGDPTLLAIRNRIAGKVTASIPGLSTSSYTNLSQIGIESDYKTGKLSIDSAELSSALSSNPTAASKLFVGTATPTNQAIKFESKTSKTEAGIYSISLSAAPEQATLTGDNDLSSTGLASDETLIFKYSDNHTDSDATSTAFSVTLNSGSTINTIVTTLNSAFATNDVELTASNSSGKLKITSDDYGADIWLKITTDQGHATDQIWDTSGSREDDGVDIAGSINNHVAQGEGNILTATSGFPEEGLKISTTTNEAGLYGRVRVSRGIADLIPSIIESYIDSDSGILKSKESSLQDSIDDIDSQIERMEKRLEEKEERLLAEFARLEVVLSQYDTLAQYLASNLVALPTIGK